jgi:hypothetical protein
MAPKSAIRVLVGRSEVFIRKVSCASCDVSRFLDWPKKMFFRDIPLCSQVEVYRRFRGTQCLHVQGQRVSQANCEEGRKISACLLLLPDYLFGFSLTLKTEAILSSETSENFYRTTRRHIPKEVTLHTHRCENLKPNVIIHIQ